MAKECSKVARKVKWEDYLAEVLLTKPAEVVQEACKVLVKHGCRLKKKLKSELYYSSTLYVFNALVYFVPLNTLSPQYLQQ